MIPSGGNAVMASRREPPDSLDFFPTPPWATRAFLRHVLPALGGACPPIRSAWDPCCGEGHMAEVLRESIVQVRASDIFDYGRGYEVGDFLDAVAPAVRCCDLICANPPFKPAAQFARRAFQLAPVVAFLLRAQWLEGEDRYETILRDRPPTLYAPFVERVCMLRGRWEPKGSTATAYAWFVWVEGAAPLPPFFIPPGRKHALTRPDDARRFGARTDAPLLDPMDPA
ncbi:hypothetical protein [Methylobacterium sp.]|uniref:hypothetical protein n=1 Tax=Methylobacterium sp. TaxID=409 RepID=UPI0025CB93B0|nr:hypothetical protein [Methylobacterium sp.]MBY0259581.1 hypothetical protein [Methylobacterium sp.]